MKIADLVNQNYGNETIGGRLAAGGELWATSCGLQATGYERIAWADSLPKLGLPAYADTGWSWAFTSPFCTCIGTVSK